MWTFGVQTETYLEVERSMGLVPRYGRIAQQRAGQMISCGHSQEYEVTVGKVSLGGLCVNSESRMTLYLKQTAPRGE